MMAKMTETQARALAALVAALRPEWGQAGIMAALSEAGRTVTLDPWVLTTAAVAAARDTANRTPAMIAQPGPWWPKDAPATTRPAPCPKDGHQGHPAHSCGYCRAEELAPVRAVVAEARDQAAERRARRETPTSKAAAEARAALEAALRTARPPAPRGAEDAVDLDAVVTAARGVPVVMPGAVGQVAADDAVDLADDERLA